MSYVPHMGYARPHTPGVRRRREDEIHTWHGARYTCTSTCLNTTNTTTGCGTVQVGWEQAQCAGKVSLLTYSQGTCLYVQLAYSVWFRSISKAA